MLLSVQTLYTHIVADIKNINAKHKNNKVNTVSVLLCSCIIVLLSFEHLNLTGVCRVPDSAELYVHHAERQQPHHRQDLSGRHGGALQEERLVSRWFSCPDD